MSVITMSESGYVLCHSKYLAELYCRVKKGDDYFFVQPHEHLFLVNTPYKRDAEAEKEVMSVTDNSTVRERKRRRLTKHSGSQNITPNTTSDIKKASLALIKDAQQQGFFNFLPSIHDIKDNNQDARNLSTKLYRESFKWIPSAFSGANNTDDALIMQFGSEHFLFPANCRFFCRDVSEIGHYVDELGKFDLILLDPPWWNKYIRRKKAKHLEDGYNMMHTEDLKELPLNQILAPGGIIAVWCTNSDSHLNALCNDLFPAWGARQVACWKWLKVTRSGEPVCPYTTPPGKQPFEQLIFGVSAHSENREHPLPQNGKHLISVPSSIHSHKPPLAEVLRPYLPPHPRSLEVFARSLLPHWTSWGLEVIKLQHTSLFTTPHSVHSNQNSFVESSNS